MFEKAHFDRELAKLERHANAGYFVALHIRFTSPLINIQTYDQAWMDHYTNNGYVLRDPMTAWAFSTTGWTRWSDPELHDPYGIFDEARKFGLHYGVTISTGPIGSRTIVSLSRVDREFSDEEIEEIREVGDLVEVEHDLANFLDHRPARKPDARAGGSVEMHRQRGPSRGGCGKTRHLGERAQGSTQLGPATSHGSHYGRGDPARKGLWASLRRAEKPLVLVTYVPQPQEALC